MSLPVIPLKRPNALPAARHLLRGTPRSGSTFFSLICYEINSALRTPRMACVSYFGQKPVFPALANMPASPLPGIAIPVQGKRRLLFNDDATEPDRVKSYRYLRKACKVLAVAPRWRVANASPAAFACASAGGSFTNPSAAHTASLMSTTRIAAPSACASSAASVKLKVCGPITTGQTQAAASIKF